MNIIINYTVQHDISNYTMPYHNTTEYITLQCNVIQYNITHYNTIQRNTIYHNISQHSTIKDTTTQYNTT